MFIVDNADDEYLLTPLERLAFGLQQWLGACAQHDGDYSDHEDDQYHNDGDAIDNEGDDDHGR